MHDKKQQQQQQQQQQTASNNQKNKHEQHQQHQQQAQPNKTTGSLPELTRDSIMFRNNSHSNNCCGQGRNRNSLSSTTKNFSGTLTEKLHSLTERFHNLSHGGGNKYSPSDFGHQHLDIGQSIRSRAGISIIEFFFSYLPFNLF